MKFIYRTLILVTLLFTLTNCEKRNIRYATYLETQCADAWGNASTRNETIQLVKNYFAEKGAIIINIEFNSANVMVCEACGCYSGREIKVSIDKNEVEILVNHGFTLVKDD